MNFSSVTIQEARDFLNLPGMQSQLRKNKLDKFNLKSMKNNYLYDYKNKKSNSSKNIIETVYLIDKKNNPILVFLKMNDFYGYENDSCQSILLTGNSLFLGKLGIDKKNKK